MMLSATLKLLHVGLWLRYPMRSQTCLGRSLKLNKIFKKRRRGIPQLVVTEIVLRSMYEP